ncbi:MAG: hypothetical protein J0H17_00405 [Rhizobiales bacterium]|jgi:hypothetical protein|nr:hypothetical protein [Hyphomicrobiales bacterium]
MSDDPALDPDAAQVVAKVRRLMLFSVLLTGVAVAAVLGVIGYRVYRNEGAIAAAVPDVTSRLPKGARIVSSAVAGDRIVLTLDINGATELRTFDVHTLKPAGRLQFVNEP